MAFCLQPQHSKLPTKLPMFSLRLQPQVFRHLEPSPPHHQYISHPQDLTLTLSLHLQITQPAFCSSEVHQLRASTVLRLTTQTHSDLSFPWTPSRPPRLSLNGQFCCVSPVQKPRLLFQPYDPPGLANTGPNVQELCSDASDKQMVPVDTGSREHIFNLFLKYDNIFNNNRWCQMGTRFIGVITL